MGACGYVYFDDSVNAPIALYHHWSQILTVFIMDIQQQTFQLFVY